HTTLSFSFSLSPIVYATEHLPHRPLFLPFVIRPRWLQFCRSIAVAFPERRSGLSSLQLSFAHPLSLVGALVGISSSFKSPVSPCVLPWVSAAFLRWFLLINR
ncbi:unnamed protein product, partial [Citrullus colocynthis]